EGHTSYRAVAHELHRLIAEQHPAVAAAMTHVDETAEPRLERLLAEIRNAARAASPSRCRRFLRSSRPKTAWSPTFTAPMMTAPQTASQNVAMLNGPTIQVVM